MLRNYLKVALRMLRKQKGYAAINVVGLAAGLAACLLIVLFVQDELRYDRFHANAGRIYRVASTLRFGDDVAQMPKVPHVLAPTLVDEVPAVEAAVRFRGTQPAVRRGDRLFREERFYFTDPSVFDVFTFPLVEGDAQTALATPDALVLTERAAHKYFGTASPVGQVLAVEGVGDLRVTAVAADPPAYSNLQFDFLAPYAALEATAREQLAAWDVFITNTFVLVEPGYDAARLEADLAGVSARHMEADWGTFFVDPLVDLHLKAFLQGDLGTGSDIRYVYLFSSLALFILLVACLNFMSLSTARSAERAREVGMRKVLGAGRRQLVGQFLGESVLMAGFALLLALALVELALPAFNDLTAKRLALSYRQPLLLAGLLAGGLVVGVLAGSYPAFALSAFRPIRVLKGQTARGTALSRLRKGLVVVQFGIAVALIAGTLGITQQLGYLRTKDLGFDREQVLVLPVRDAMQGHVEAVKAAVRSRPEVVAVAAGSHTQGRGMAGYFVRPEGVTEAQVAVVYGVDPDYIETMRIRVVAGRGFSADHPTDADGAFVINQAAARAYGWGEAAVGRPLTLDDSKPGRVIGVVEDFHVESLHQAIRPLVMHLDPAGVHRLAVRLRPGDPGPLLAYLGETWRQLDPAHPFEYTFVDEDFARHYRVEERTGYLVEWAAGLAVLIAALGLLGLAAFAAQRRAKEIGVRKVLGATVPQLVVLLTGEFARLVVVAFAVAAPVAYVVMQRWLAGFAYRAEVSWWLLAAAGGIALVVALATVGYQALRAALSDPVKALRYE